jgi:transcription antitermination factor NusG
LSVSSFEPWFVVQVVPRLETKVSLFLKCHGYESFLPTYKVKRRWSDRIKVLHQPLFPGYVFYRVNAGMFHPRTGESGMVRVVSFGGKPSAIPEDEIDALHQIVRTDVKTYPFHPYLRIGQKVQIKDGPLSGIVGAIVQIKNTKRLILSVDAVMQSICVDADVCGIADMSQKTDSFMIPY